MEILPLVFVLGCVSGRNTFVALFAVALMARTGHLTLVSGYLDRGWLVVLLGVLTVLEMLVDLVPHLDTFWDTRIWIGRAVVASLVVPMVTAGTPALSVGFLAVVCALVAGASALVNAGGRLLLNHVPTPGVRLVCALASDALVVGLLLLVLWQPWWAAALAALRLAHKVYVVWSNISDVERARHELHDRVNLFFRIDPATGGRR